jgi:hypothetical protein
MSLGGGFVTYEMIPLNMGEDARYDGRRWLFHLEPEDMSDTMRAI